MNAGNMNTNTSELFPGKHEPSTIYEYCLYKQMLRFIGGVNGKCVDIGGQNIKMDFLKKEWGINVKQLDSEDFNECKLSGKYDTVFCFEIIEHLQNPLHFMKQLRKIGKTVFLTTPARPMFLWSPHHFFEMPPKHIEKFIFIPSGFTVVRKKRLYVSFRWWFYLTGIRPFLRLFLNTKWIYELR